MAGALAVAGSLRHAGAAESVRLLVFMEHGVGAPAQAQPYIDKLVGLAKAQNGWGAAEGIYVTQRAQAERFIETSQPQFGIFSLGAFLGARKAHKLDVLGVADVARAGGRKFHIVSHTATELGACKGKKLATNHAGDPRFIDKVVAGGAFTLGEFTVVATQRPVQTIKSVIKGEAECALIDNAQYDELPHVDGASGIKAVWSSAEPAPMAVVAFSGAEAPDRAKFKSSLGSLCSGAGKEHCDRIGIKSLRATDDAAFAATIASYGN
ncbi:MAG: hypothetical protein EXR75_04530 [Myxococcales bacterium]|nr:hypothetical protein [Myxococcales bacterium]